MNKLIVIPARGGSKGIPKKNIYPLNGKPLLSYTIELALSSKLDNTDIVVSTDSIEIKEVAQNFQNVYVIDRPSELASDTASTEDALLHSIDYMEKKLNKKYDAVITLQPTSPLRKKETFVNFIDEFEKTCGRYDALLSLTEDRTDFWINNEDNSFSRLYKNAPRRRQERQPLYKENSAYYITLVESLRKTHSVLGSKVNGFVVSEIEGIDINEPIDIKIVESLVNDNKYYS